MKKLLGILVVLGVLCFTTAARADLIDFLNYDWHNLQGVDSPSGWSSDDTMVNLWTNNWSLLGGNASVNGYGGLFGLGGLTHRGTRGLGVYGGENDEINNRASFFSGAERIEVVFNTPYYLDYLQVRSLYDEDTGIELGNVDFYLNGSNFYTENLSGIETSGYGKNSVSYADAKLIDKLVFYVPSNTGSCNSESEFAVAKLKVRAVPEPISATLFLFGGATLALRAYRKRQQKA